MRTIEALLACAAGGGGDVAACRIEGSGDPLSMQTVDSVDFDLIDAEGGSLMAVQVKSASADQTVRAPAAVSVLIHLITGPEARQYRLITSAAPDAGCLRLAEVLRRHGDDVEMLQAEIETLLGRAPKTLRMCQALSLEQWMRLGRASIEFDVRDEVGLREDLNTALRSFRSQAGGGLSIGSGGLVLGYLVAEVLRRAANPVAALWSIDDFRRTVLVGDGELLAAVGRQDFGLVYGQIPPMPSVSRPHLVSRLGELLDSPTAGEAVSVCVITGLSGLGKSSLAAAYIADQAYHYDVIFWVDADTEDSLIASYARILSHLTGSGEQVSVTDPRLLRERVHAHLQTLPGPWLMVFDDANARTARAWLPPRGRGRLIVTSLGGSWRSARHLELGPMADDEAMQLLRTRLELTNQQVEQYEGPLSRLTQTLEYWPLAIDVACGYLVSCGIGVDRLAAYTDKLITRAADDEDSVPAGYPRTLTAAVGLSIDRLVEAARAKGLLPETLTVLGALCWLAPRRAPVHLVLAAALLDPGTLPSVSGLVLFDETSVPVREIFRELRNVSLVRYDDPLPARIEVFPGSDDTVSMNAVLQPILSSQLQLSDRAPVGLPIIAGHTDRWLRQALSGGEAERAWVLAQHAAAVIRHAALFEVAHGLTALLAGNLAAFHQAHGQYDDAEELLALELEWLKQAGDPDPGLTAQAHIRLAYVAQLRQRTDVATQLDRHLRPALSYLRQVEGPPQLTNAELAFQGVVMLRAELRAKGDGVLSQLLDDFQEVASTVPPTEGALKLTDLSHIERLISEGADENAEKAISDVLSKSPDPWASSTVDLKRLLVETLISQDRWIEANDALTNFLPYAGPYTLYGYAVHHLLHNAGTLCAWKWIAAGEVRAVELLGRLLYETGIIESTYPVVADTATDQARIILLRVVYEGWRGVRQTPIDHSFLKLMDQLKDKVFIDPHVPGNIWERIYSGLSLRLPAVMADVANETHQMHGDVVLAANQAVLEENEELAADYAAGACDALLALSSDPLYQTLVGGSSLDLLLPEARKYLPGPKPLVFLQPITMIAASDPDGGRHSELQIHRACAKGLRRLILPQAMVPPAMSLTLSVSGRDIVLKHDDGTIVARASVPIVPKRWRDAAQAHGSALVFYGFGLDPDSRAAHRRLMSSPTDLFYQFRTVSEVGLLAAGLVPLVLQPEPPAATERSTRTASVRKQPRKLPRSARKRRSR